MASIPSLRSGRSRPRPTGTPRIAPAPRGALLALVVAAAALTVASGSWSPGLARESGVIVGPDRVVDGDTIRINGIRIRLYGIDAPERRQLCTVRGRPSRCGRLASRALADRIGGAVVTCEPRDRDRYGRVVAVCRAGGEDLNAWMVAQGWAMAYRRYARDYIGDEIAAAAARRGIWQGDFVPPWDWRHRHRHRAARVSATRRR